MRAAQRFEASIGRDTVEHGTQSWSSPARPSLAWQGTTPRRAPALRHAPPPAHARCPVRRALARMAVSRPTEEEDQLLWEAATCPGARRQEHPAANPPCKDPLASPGMSRFHSVRIKIQTMSQSPNSLDPGYGKGPQSTGTKNKVASRTPAVPLVLSFTDNLPALR